jgi:serine/threonine-protein kinase
MRALAAVCLIATLTGSAAARDLRPYQDARSGAAAVVPAEWRELPPDERWLGTRFVSPDGSSWLAIYAALPTDSIEAHMDATARVDGETVTLLVRRPGWLVVSGRKGDRIFFRKAMLACHGTVWHHVAAEYPADRQRLYDPLVSIVSRSLEPGRNACG